LLLPLADIITSGDSWQSDKSILDEKRWQLLCIATCGRTSPRQFWDLMMRPTAILNVCDASNASPVFRWPFCPSVCLSAKRVNCDKTVTTSPHILIPYDRTYILVFGHEKLLVREDCLYPEFQ